jgi:general secretion pathway protein D
MRRLGALLVCLALGACASSGSFRAGRRAESRDDFDRAVLDYARALKERPGNTSYRLSLERARLRAAEAHLVAARRFDGRGHTKEALDEARLALDLNPDSGDVRSFIRDVEARTRAAGAAASLDAIKERVRERPLSGLTLAPAARHPLGLTFANASLREIYQALGRVSAVNFVFDPQFIDQNVSVDLRDVDFDQALNALATIGRTFYRVSNEKLVTIVPDNANKRREYEQQIVKTFFLSNAEPKETADLLRVLLGARRVAVLPDANAVTINDAPEKVAAAERVVAVVDKKRAEVVVEVEILEVNRSRLKDYGIEITSNISAITGIAGGIFPNTTIKEEQRDASGQVIRDYQGVPILKDRPLGVNDNPYASKNLLVSNLPGVIYRLLQTDSSTRLLANPQLRISDGQSAKARFGDKVPVPVTTFVPIAQGGVQTQPFTSFQYENVGVNIDIKPRVHQDGDITLELELEISALAGAGYQNLPTFSTRSVKSVIRLHDGETNVLAGLIRDSERRSLNGVPGLASLPLLGALFSHNQTEAAQTDIIMTLTPHVVGRPDITEDDLRSFIIGAMEGSAAPGSDSAAPPTPYVPPPGRGGEPQRTDQPARAEPIRPPGQPPTSPR